MPARTNAPTAPQGRIIPGTFWYAYGSSAFDLSAYQEETYLPRLHVVEGGSGGRRVERRLEARTAARRRCRSLNLALGMALVLLVAGLLAGGGLVALGSSASAAADIPTVAVAVDSGDTLWSLAERYPIEGMTTRQCVKWIMEHNSLESALLMPGQIVEVPATAG